MENNVKSSPANWKSRIISGTIILVILIGIFCLRLVNNYVFDLLIGIVAIFSAFEVENLMHKMDRPTWSSGVGMFPIVCFVALILTIHSGLVYYHYILITIVALIFMFLIMLLLPVMFSKWGNKCRVKDEYASSLKYYSFTKATNTVFVCLWPTLLMSFAFLTNHFVELGMPNAETYANTYHTDVGLLGLITMVTTTVFADVCAMLAGRFIGGPKISLEKLGPGKSWVGLFAGILGAMIGAVLVFVVFNSFDSYSSMFNAQGINFTSFLVGGLCCGIFTMAGDIFSSFFKRKAVVKDFSNLIPGHGGVMDRCNGLTLNAVMVFILFVVLFR